MNHFLHLCNTKVNYCWVTKKQFVMILEFSQAITHPCTKPSPSKNDEETQKKVIEIMKSIGINVEDIRRKQDGVLEISKLPGLKLHSLMLRAEQQGLDIKYTKKTVIEIC